LLERFSEALLPPRGDQRQLQPVAEEDGHWLDALYVTFEDYFRGPRQQVKENLQVYLPYLRQVRAGIPEAPMLDVGCGRGEWLELLREQGLSARGLDINRVMVRECQMLGLDVVEADVIAYLSQLQDNSLGVVTGFHIIEHLPFKILIELLDQARRVLKPGGMAIFETPNPENIVVGAYTFYLDPTHRNPLPPIAGQRLAEIRGFVKADILRLHRRDEVGHNDPLVEKWFRTETDYALICHK
jgi:O-antigen chain-terminating methyltransferase